MELHGAWFGVKINTVANWERLLAAANNGDEHALGYIAFLNSKYQRPECARSQGITTLIKGYSAFAGTHKGALREYKQKLARLKQQALEEATTVLAQAQPQQSSASGARNLLFEGVDSSDDYISQSPPSYSILLPGIPESIEGSTMM